MNFLALIPVKDWLYLGLALAIAGLGALFVSHEREIGAHKAEAALQHERAEVAAVGAAAASAAAAESLRREATLQEIVHASQQTNAQLAVSVAAAADQRRDLGSLFDAYIRGSTGANHPAATPGSAPAADPLLVCADLYRRAESRATDLALLADQRGGSGATCERFADALTPAKPP